MRVPSILVAVVAPLFALHAVAQSTTSTTASPTASISLSLTTASATLVLTTRTAGRSSVLTSLVPTTFNVTHTIAPTSTSTSTSSSATTSSSHSATPTSNPLVLETKIDPAFSVLGALLILTGLPSTFWGHKNRWTSFFLIGFYTLSLVCFVLILKFGILAAVNPPTNSLRGLFVLACAIAGVAGGAIAIFFWKAARYGIGAWGGFALALWIQCFHNGGVIKPIGLRWILFLACAVVGFMVCTIPKIHYHILLISTAFVGSSAFMLGVDCFTTAGLKEFYIWNLGFRDLFPKFTTHHIQFPVSQTMQIELGLIGAIALIGTAVQLRILSVLHMKLEEIGQEQKKRDEEAESQAADRFVAARGEQARWEKEHPTLSRHGRQDSGLSSLPLLKDKDGSVSPPTTADLTFVQDGRPRNYSVGSDFRAAPTPDEELRRAARNPQSPGALPALDLGLGIQDDVPHGFIASDELRHKEHTDDLRRKDLSSSELEELKRKEELVLEIQTIRRSIEALKSETPIPSSSDASRRPSMISRRTLSIDANNALLPTPSHLRPPRETDPRTRAHSMELSSLGYSLPLGTSISRPTSVPVRDEEWDSYVQERKLLQPPAGVTPPIATTPIAPAPRIPVAPAITEALNKRKERESALGYRVPSTDSSDDIPLAKVTRHKHTHSAGGSGMPVTILPPRRGSPVVSPTPQRPSPGRTRTFEELNERHREKMRDLQAPLTRAEKEEADVRAARQRWERNKALEKEAVTRRQAEKAAQLEKRRRAEDVGHRTLSPDRQHSRSLSHDRLAAFGPSSKRLSTLKVEDWQKYQQDLEMGVRGMGGDLGSKRQTRALSPSSGVPFPDREKGSRGRMSRDPLS